jgi:large subunit ribosomal protein L20
VARATSSVTSHRRHRKILSAAKGYRGARRRLVKAAHEAVMHAGQYAYRHRRERKRDIRRLWIVRINAAARLAGMPYSIFMAGLRKAGVGLDRRMLAEMAVNDSAAFAALVEKAKTA